jgi:hypothetical protein
MYDVEEWAVMCGMHFIEGHLTDISKECDTASFKKCSSSNKTITVVTT